MATVLCMQVVAFEKAGLLRAKGEKECRREADRSKAFADAITHTVSLLHAVCLQHLRGDWDLGNLCSHDPDGAPPPTVSRHTFKFRRAFAMRCASVGGISYVRSQHRPLCSPSKACLCELRIVPSLQQPMMAICSMQCSVACPSAIALSDS